MVIEFVWRWINYFIGGVFWVNGESDENVSKLVVENFVFLNVVVFIRENVDDFLNKFLIVLFNENCLWFFVVDNVDDVRSLICFIGVEKICKGFW